MLLDCRKLCDLILEVFGLRVIHLITVLLYKFRTLILFM